MTASPPRLLILAASPRRNGNSAALAAAVREGAEAAGTPAVVRFLDDHLTGFLRDCRQCRDADGRCRIDDGFRDLFFDEFLPAQGVALCTPVYWYGMSAQAKAFFDRMFCYFARSYPDYAQTRAGVAGKKVALLTASEEIYPGIALGIVQQLQEYARYTRSQFIGTVHAYGNQRGEIVDAPEAPLQAARALGREFFQRRYWDLQFDSVR